MKKLLIITLLTFIVSSVLAQNLKLRSYSSTYSYVDKNGGFPDLKVNQIRTSILIVIKDKSISIFAKTPANYSIIAVDDVKYGDAGPYSETNLVDDDGIQCTGKVYMPYDTDTYHVIIQYQNVMFVYNCREEK